MKTLTSSSNGGECRNLSLGLTTKARCYKVVGQEETHESHHMLLKVQRV
jgi:hypothetical protein